MCFRGNCVRAAPYFSNDSLDDPCIPNPCQNGGICTKNITTSSLFCKCPSGVSYSGKFAL